MGLPPAPASDFDFRKPCALAAEVEQGLKSWQESICRLTNERWLQLLPEPWKWAPGAVTSNRPGRLEFAEPIVAYAVLVGSESRLTILTMPRRLALTMVLGILGQSSSEWATDKELTALEEMAVRVALERFIEACNETAPATPTCQLDEFFAKPDLLRIFRNVRDIVVDEFVFETPSGPGRIAWIWPEEFATATFGGEATGAQSAETQKNLRELSREIPFELVIRLGTTRLPISELSALCPGDVLLLDQRVSDTLRAYLGNLPSFAGWAGRVGKWQGFQVQEILRKSH